MEKQNKPNPAKHFIIGGTSGCLATCVIQPIDMVKVQIQLMGEGGDKVAQNISSSRNPLSVARAIIQKDGVIGLYRGLDAGLARQITYTTARTGLYRMFSDLLAQKGPPLPGSKEPTLQPLPLYKKGLAGLLSGGFGSLIGNPCDLALVRMQADITLPPAQKRGYTGIFNAIYRIVKEEGVVSLWRGSTPTVLRAMVLNAALFAPSEQAKEYLKPRIKDPFTISIIASAFGGFCAATASLPFDFLKTRMQKMAPDPVTGLNPYKNVFDCAVKVARKEGLLRFYSGYGVYCFRVAPHGMMTLVFIDTLTRIF